MWFHRFFRVLWKLGWVPWALAICGALVQLLWVQAQPPRYLAIGKMVPEFRHMPGDRITALESPQGQRNAEAERERLFSGSLQRQALERARMSHPELKEADVTLDIVPIKGSSIVRIAASGAKPQFARACVDAFLDEASETSQQKYIAAWRAHDLAGNTEESRIKAWTEAPFLWVIMERPGSATSEKSSLVEASLMGAAAGLGLGLLMVLGFALRAAFVPTSELATV